MYFYQDETNCLPFDRSERLTPNDTLSLMVGDHLPYAENRQGWLYVVAMDPISRLAIDFDYLIGQATYFDAIDTTWFEMNAASFRAVPGEGLPTDLDLDGHHDLNGIEYTMFGENQIFPRFIGLFQNGQNQYQASLLLLNLSGGAWFQSSIDVLIYNDNEQIWSTTHTFSCWELVPLQNISAVFYNDFLLSTSHDPDEELNLLGNPHIETGWFKANGDYAWNVIKTIEDPALMCFLFEWYNNHLIVSPPFDNGAKQDNATLWPLSPLGDNED
jgi:hypothetical protein